MSNFLGSLQLLSPTDINSAINNYGKMNKDLLSLYSSKVSHNIQCPQRIDEITYIKAAEINSDSYEIIYEIDDSLIDMSLIQRALTEAKADYLEDYRKAYAQDVLDACIATGRSLKCTYIGKKSKKKAILLFSPKELSVK